MRSGLDDPRDVLAASDDLTAADVADLRLSVSRDVGYELSPRGRAFLAAEDDPV